MWSAADLLSCKLAGVVRVQCLCVCMYSLRRLIGISLSIYIEAGSLNLCPLNHPLILILKGLKRVYNIKLL